MKKFLIVLAFVFLLSIYAFGNEVKCNYTIDFDSDDFISLFDNESISNKKATGILCVKSSEDLSKMIFNVKNGFLIGGAEVELFEKNELSLSMASNNYEVIIKIFERLISDSIDHVMDNLYLYVANNSLTINAYENNIIVEKLTLDNNEGSYTTYYENGAMRSYIPVKNFKYNGDAEVYDKNGRLWSTITYQNDKIIAGKCANYRIKGAEWTKAEIYNWENGLEVDCSYH